MKNNVSKTISSPARLYLSSKGNEILEL